MTLITLHTLLNLHEYENGDKLNQWLQWRKLLAQSLQRHPFYASITLNVGIAEEQDSA